MTNALVVILMGSKADLDHCQKIGDTLDKYGISYVMRIGSAHKVPERVLAMLAEYEADPRPKVYITVAGRSNALSGVVDAAVQAPVLACPPTSSTFGGNDIFSSLRMPSGVTPAVILSPQNAALFAAKILGVSDPDIRARVAEAQQGFADLLIQDDTELLESQQEV